MPAPLPIEIYLICFAAASVIHAAQTVLAAKLFRQPNAFARVDVRDGVAIGFLSFGWQFGNLLLMLAAATGRSETALYRTGDAIRHGALVCFPLLFSYVCLHLLPASPGNRLRRAGAWLRYPLWPWTGLSVAIMAAADAGFPVMEGAAQFVNFATLHLMLFYFIVLTITAAGARDAARSTGVRSIMLARKAGVIGGLLAIATFVLMLSGYWDLPVPLLAPIELAAMLTSVPFAIAAAYRLYQFPFMDVFIREVISGVMLLAAFAAALSVSRFALWVAGCAILLAYGKAPLTRWVERRFIGYEESVEDQEERIGAAIRALTRLDEFGARVSEILAGELEAEWVEINAEPRRDAVQRLEIPGSGLLLSAGRRSGGRQYMSRHLRIARTAALQLAAHHHQLAQHELRDATARAQMRALKAQINPHFLFNTLNVLANLIHSNPSKAERVTEDLAEVFRYALESTRLEWVTLGDELNFVQSYLEIEKARFEERLAYSFEIDEALRSSRIPPMVLQPLVENAIKHGIGPNVTGGSLCIEARMAADRLELIVEDTGAGTRSGSRSGGAGVGLANIRERLQYLYGEAGGLRFETIQPAGTRAIVTLPQFVGAQS